MPGFSFTVLWLCLTLNSVGSYAQRRYSGRPEPIGQGVTVHAEVLYDETVMKRENSATELEMKARTPSFGDFQAIFRKVEEHFNNYSVMIKITVGNITKNKNLSVIFEGMKHSLDGPKTLGKLKEYGKQTFASNDTVFYLFTARHILQATNMGDQVPLELFSIQTTGTFCSTNISAAIVTYVDESYGYDFAAQATAGIFGSNMYNRFSRSDRKRTNETFSRCHITPSTNFETEANQTDVQTGA